VDAGARVTQLSSTLAALGLPATLEPALAAFLRLFLKWNRSINLSAARTEPDLIEHIVDSLHVVPYLRTQPASQTSPLRVLDVGAGGGLPSVIAAICLPDVHITALEPVHKKHAFLRTAARELALSNLDPRADRIDDHVPRDYDVALSRATFDLREWLALGLTCVRQRPGLRSRAPRGSSSRHDPSQLCPRHQAARPGRAPASALVARPRRRPWTARRRAHGARTNGYRTHLGEAQRSEGRWLGIHRPDPRRRGSRAAQRPPARRCGHVPLAPSPLAARRPTASFRPGVANMWITTSGSGVWPPIPATTGSSTTADGGSHRASLRLVPVGPAAAVSRCFFNERGHLQHRPGMAHDACSTV